MAGEPSRSARGILVDWANRQDDWARAIVADVLASRSSLSAETRNELKAIFLAEKRLSDERPRTVPTLVDEAHDSAGATTFRLTRLRDCQNVNRLAGNQEIEFGSRVTILYGENASGKTGYVRILKRVSGVRGAKRVLPDITVSAAGPPAAEIQYEIDGTSHTIQWNDESGLQPFNRITVFDTPTASIHLTDSLEYVFTPADLALYEVVHAEINALRKDLATRSRVVDPLTSTSWLISSQELNRTPSLRVSGLALLLFSLRIWRQCRIETETPSENSRNA